MNYINEVTQYGCVPSYAIKKEEFVWYKNSKKKQAISFKKDYVPDCETSFMYIEEKPSGIKCDEEIELIQGPFTKEWFELRGQKYRHLKNLRNKFKEIEIRNETTEEEFKALINNWEEPYEGCKKCGYGRYGFLMHSGREKSYYKKYREMLKDKTIQLYFYLNNELIGYSLFSKPRKNEEGILETVYIFGKYKLGISNLSRYLDYKSYEYLSSLFNDTFVVNLGCSSGTLLKYKRQTFPIYRETPRYFYKVKVE